jgi:transcription elongation factor GreB
MRTARGGGACGIIRRRYRRNHDNPWRSDCPHTARACPAPNRGDADLSRWRPPQPGSTAVITRAGFETLRRELDELWHQRRPEVVKALAAAAAEGDRSENAEYTYRKKQLAEIDRRVRYLSKRLPALRVIEQTPVRSDTVYFGALVEVVDESGAHRRLRLVGPDETDAKRHWVSIDSPLARALLGKHVGDECEAQLPEGARRYRILGIGYGADCDN